MCGWKSRGLGQEISSCGAGGGKLAEEIMEGGTLKGGWPGFPFLTFEIIGHGEGERLFTKTARRDKR